MAPVICRIISSNRAVWMCCRSCDSLHKSVCLYDGGVMPEERLTEDLLARLRAAASPQEYLDEEVTLDRTLSTYLHELLNEKGMKIAEVIRASGVQPPTVTYDIFKGKCLHPGRDKTIMIAFGMGCTFEETQRILRLAGTSELWPKVRRDAIIAWCIDHDMTREECDDTLWDLGEVRKPSH